MCIERFMVTGKRLDGGGTVMGYLYDGRYIINSHDYNGGCDGHVELICGGYEVDPASVEPAAKPVDKIGCGSSHGKPFSCGECPNCGQTVASSKNYPYELRANDYCGRCGQRLDWEGVE
jgi:hypothetical protein